MVVIYYLIVFAVLVDLLTVQYNNSMVAVSIWVRLLTLCFFKFSSQHLLSENPLPTHFNLPSDYQNVKNQLGSIFYKTLQNKMDFLTAKNQCELDGILSNSTVHLPIPKSG